MASPKTQLTQTAKPAKRSFFRSPWFPGILVAIIFGTAILSMTGVIQLPHIGNLASEIKPEATIGVPCRYDFADALIPLLDPNYNGDRSGYTFYLGSGVGFPPMGLILGVDGVLTGTPTGTPPGGSGKFQVCVKDVGGNAVCRTYHLAVNPVAETDNDNNVQPGGCTTDARCGQPSNPNQPAGLNNPIIDGIVISKSCSCPTGTVFHTDYGTTQFCACQ